MDEVTDIARIISRESEKPTVVKSAQHPQGGHCMQPLTAKELEYIADSMSNEDLLMKQCVVAAVQAKNGSVKQLCHTLLDRHARHYEHLMNTLQQHVHVAPMS